MNVVGDNIWNYIDNYLIVVTTNIGWNRYGQNVMGAGIAKQAAAKFPELPEWYGKFCQEYKANTPVVLAPNGKIVLFPTKKLNSIQPWLSWKENSDLALIERSLIQLKQLEPTRKIATPIPGCANGGLSQKDVMPLLERYLTEDRFLVVDRNVLGEVQY